MAAKLLQGSCRWVGHSSCCRTRCVFLHPCPHSWRVSADPPDHLRYIQSMWTVRKK